MWEATRKELDPKGVLANNLIEGLLGVGRLEYRLPEKPSTACHTVQ